MANVIRVLPLFLVNDLIIFDKQISLHYFSNIFDMLYLLFIFTYFTKSSSIRATNASYFAWCRFVAFFLDDHLCWLLSNNHIQFFLPFKVLVEAHFRGLGESVKEVMLRVQDAISSVLICEGLMG